ncbi:MAG: acyl-CoA dehydratase activase [Dissulfurispiraceae bacterium]
MKRGGIDIGSRYIKYVLLEDSGSFSFKKKETGHEPLRVCQELIGSYSPSRLMATGYGRYLLEVHGNVQTITEIKAVARGAREVFPSCRTIIDIGGQDTKVISLSKDGRVVSFEMNDRCAAGTGKFLEIMAKALSYNIEDFGSQCSGEDKQIKINSMCTVFAESEVIGLISKGAKRDVIAQALHRSIVDKVTALIKRIGVEEDIVFAGGCAKNLCLKRLLEERLRSEVLVHDYPDMLGALGAAHYAAENNISLGKSYAQL